MVNVHSSSKGKGSKLLSKISSASGGISNNNLDIDYLPNSTNTINAGFEHTSEIILANSSLPQYAILKYGDNCELIFNTNCKVNYLTILSFLIRLLL